MAQPTAPPSLLEYGIEQHYPVQLLLASQWGSGSLETCVYRSGPSLNWSLKPAAAEDTLGIVLRGESTLTRRLGRKTEHQPLATGLAVLIPSHTESELRWTGTDEWLHFFVNPLFKARIANEVFDRDPMRLELSYNFLFSDVLIAQIGYNLLAEMKMRGPLGHLYVDCLAQALVVHLFQRYTVVRHRKAWRAPRGQLSPQTLRRIQDFVLANLEQNLRLDDVAHEVNLSAYHLTRTFKHTTGVSLYQFVIKQRIEKASHLLLTTELSLKTIAAQTGFTDQSHLTNSFRQWFGTTPGEYAQQRKNLQKPRKNLQDD